LTTIGFQQVVSAFWYDASSGIVNRGIGIAETSASYMTFQMADTGARSATSGLANGDAILWTGTIEITA
jgi:hypothetical protein